ncbi:hypothetical protein Patl1_08237 [Pistacia atlantica]|uniref:Uncharacterized protein n=1 Tax=Pistacia atlantica TaxID=434234 RepID=A0ACC1AK82_9ROSI|nr:hypothetical protein Patl1_08237 [Pistacia atlantica]
MGIQRMLLQLITIIGSRVILAASAEPNKLFRLQNLVAQINVGMLASQYPFGTTEGCSYDHNFRITCNHTLYNPPKAFLVESNINVIGNFTQRHWHKLCGSACEYLLAVLGVEEKKAHHTPYSSSAFSRRGEDSSVVSLKKRKTHQFVLVLSCRFWKQ